MSRMSLLTTVIASLVAMSFPALQVTAEQASRHGDIKVRGHWTIRVLDENGITASTTEFENAYVESELIPRMLVDKFKVNTWYLSVQADFWEWTFSLPPSPTAGLSIEAPETGPNAGKLILKGVANYPGSVPVTVGNVRVTVDACPTSGPIPCIFRVLSQRDVRLPEPASAPVPAPIVIRPHQSLDVTVVYSFY